MILLVAVGAGILAGWSYARWQKRAWYPPVFQASWLAGIGFLPQWLAIYWPTSRVWLSNEIVAWCLVASQSLLLVFAVRNLSLPGMPLLAIGLGCNLAVIAANGGFMPMTVDAFTSLAGKQVLGQITLGERLGPGSKDILLSETQMLLPWLSDRFVFPEFMPYRVAFSAGDVLIAGGAFWLLCAGQAPRLDISESGVN